MIRAILCSALVVSIGAGCQNKTEGNTKEATITKVDSKKGVVGLKMSSNGKDVENTFKLAENIEYMDSTGKVAAADIFTSGDMVLVVESEGTITKMKKKDKSDVAKQPGVKDPIAKNGKMDGHAFLRAADQINLTEIKLGKVAEEQASSVAVKKFGEKSMKDHMVMNKELRDLATKKGIKLPGAVDPKHQEMIDDVTKLKGAEFDRAYTKDMVAGHEKAIEQFETEAKTCPDAEVKAWAEKWLPTLREHLVLARETVKDVKAK